eukprot:1161762-Pelagomonas_calceolata.AAC.9
MSPKVYWAGNIYGGPRDPPRKNSKLNTKLNGTLSPLKEGLIRPMEMGNYPSSKRMGYKWPPQNTYPEGWQRTRAANFAGAQ